VLQSIAVRARPASLSPAGKRGYLVNEASSSQGEISVRSRTEKILTFHIQLKGERNVLMTFVTHTNSKKASTDPEQRLIC
jgi:hypothetical protein